MIDYKRVCKIILGSGTTPAAPAAGAHPVSGGAASNVFSPSVIHVTPQDKEAIERVRNF